MRKLVVDPKPTASLSSGLLARKGQARPAMRPQGFGAGFGPAAGGQDDLGWNDMGYDPPKPHDLANIEPVMAAVTPISPETVPADMKPTFVPPVLRQREELVEELTLVTTTVPAALPDAVIETRQISLATAARIGRETAAKTNKAAFTLRLDAARHLRLRLASAVRNVSAQALMTQALDEFLKTVPEAESLASQLPEPSRRTSR